MRWSSALLLCAPILVPAWSPPGAEAVVLRVGTLAPQHSTWMKYLWRIMREVRRATAGRVRIWLYPDGRKGSEVEMVEAMRSGNLQGAALTAVGLSRINQAFLVQQLPLLFRDHRELDCMRKRMAARIDGLLGEKGFVALGYGDVGFVHLFTRNQVTTPEELARVKMWAWEDDPISRKMLELVGINQRPRKIGQVLPALRSGDLDGFYASPYAAVALGWFRFARYFLTTRLAMAVGAIVLSQKAWASVPHGDRRAVRRVVRRWARRLNRAIRRDNARSLKVLAQSGLQPVVLRAGESSIWVSIAEKTQAHFVDKLYPQRLLTDVKAAVAACRAEAGRRHHRERR